jgi:hypothetical protein
MQVEPNINFEKKFQTLWPLLIKLYSHQYFFSAEESDALGVI